jgi:hypothetical protein
LPRPLRRLRKACASRRRSASAAAITAFNLLPTNHLYYGLADQAAFQNLIKPFVQLRLAPHPKVSLNLFAHWLELAKRNDARYTGSGALRRRSARAAPPRRRPPPRPG